MASGANADETSPLMTSGNAAVASMGPADRPKPAGTMVECVHAAQCAGCPLIHLDVPTQLSSKRARVVTAVSHYPALELLYTRPVITAEPMVGYRGRAKLIVSPEGRIGLYARTGNHEVVDIPECRVLSPALVDVAAELRKLIADPPEALRGLLLPFNPFAGGVLRALDLREVRSESGASGAEVPPEGDAIGVLVTFVLQRDRAPSREDLKEMGRLLRPRLPRVVGIAANFHEADAPQILGPDTLALDGAVRAQDRIGPTFHLASFGSFVQAHRGQAAKVHQAVAREVGKIEGGAPGSPRRVLDLYGGSGAISLALAKEGHAVVMVESFAPATVNARTAAEAQGLKGLEVRTGDVADAAAALVNAKERFDAVVVNPPRRGVSPAAREAIARLAAPLLVYVSCDPDTLARDLDHFARLGYLASELQPLDMIPLTEEVETVAVLRRSAPAVPKVIYEDEDMLVIDKGPHEPVGADEGADYGSSLLARCARLPGSPEGLLPVHRLDAGTSGLCMLAKNERARAVWAEILGSSGRLIYLAAAKGVTPAKGAITRDLREGGRSYPARTRYRRLAIASGHSILRVIPDGGRTHQIRRHLAAIGHPVIGDERYGHLPTNRYFEEKHGLDRSFLHLVRIEVQHPRTGGRLLIESTLPGDLRSALERATGGSVLRFLEQKHALGDQRASSMLPGPPPGEEGPASGRGSSLSEAPPSSRGAMLPGDAYLAALSGEGGPQSLRVPRIEGDDLPVESQRISVMVPDLDESPRTIRHAIVSDDED